MSQGKNEQQSLLPLSAKSITAGEFIYSDSLINTLAVRGIVIIPSAMSAYAFYCYSNEFWQSLLGEVGAPIVGVLTATPIALLSANSFNNALKGYWGRLKHKPKDFFTSLASLGLFQQNIWNREMNSRSAWFILQTANITAGIIKLASVPLSVIPSDALNFKKSKTWISAVPNTFTSFFMNGYYVGQTRKLVINSLAARLSDTNRFYRNELKIILNGLTRELPYYADNHPEKFIGWLDSFKNKATATDKFLGLMELFHLMHDSADITNTNYYNNDWSTVGFSLLPLALLFTMPLFVAGKNATTIFEGYTDPLSIAMDDVADTIPWQLYSTASIICNLAINGLNAYRLGDRLGFFFHELFRGNGRKHLQQLSKADIASIVAAEAIAIFSMAAQIAAAYSNPILNFFIIILLEVLGTGAGSNAVYFRATDEAISKARALFNQRSLRNSTTFNEGYNNTPDENKAEYMRILVNFVIEDHLKPMINSIGEATYKSTDNSTELNIEQLVANPIVKSATNKLPSKKRGCCGFFKPKNKNPVKFIQYEQTENGSGFYQMPTNFTT